jgi:hypothetical protein
MKKLFLLLMICVSTFVNAQEKTIETVYKDSKDGISTVYKDFKATTPQIKSALESLSKELKTTTESLWLILVKQQKVLSCCFLVLILSSLFNWFLFYKRNFTTLKDDEIVIGKKVKKGEYSYDSDIITDVILHKSLISPWFVYVHLAICITLSVFSFLHFSDMLTGFINPEFGALKTITEVVGNLK